MNLKSKLKTARVILIALFSSLNATAQTWNTVGNGLPTYAGTTSYATISTQDANAIYTANYIYISGGVTEISKWDGLAWSFYPRLNIRVYDIKVVGQEIFVCGSTTFPFTPKIYKFGGNSWIDITPTGLSGLVLSMTDFNGELVVAGSFTAIGGIQNLMKYNGTNFTAMPATWLSGIWNVSTYNGILHVSGSTNNFFSPIDSTFLRLPATNIWEAAATFSQQGRVNEMIEYQGSLYSTDSINLPILLKLDNDTLKIVGTLSHAVQDFIEYNGDLYLVGFGPSTTISKFDGTTITPLFGNPEYLTALGTLKGELYAFSDRLTSSSFSSYNRAYRTSSAFNSLLKGLTYNDANANCVNDASETTLKEVVVKLTNGFATSSNTNGLYAMGLSPGTYTLDDAYIPNVNGKNLAMTCSTPNTVVINPGQTTIKNIGLNNPVPIDATIKAAAATGWRARYGFYQNYYCEVVNTGNSPLTGAILHVEVPPSLSQVSSMPSASQQVGNIYTFNINPLAPYQSTKINIYALVDTALNSMGDSLAWHAWLDPITGDADVSDNADTLKQLVVGAYDPNDKTASAEFISHTTKRIDYHIRFQNTGTDTAYKVVVVDTLNTSLALTNVVINSASHPYSFSVVNNILVWEFDNIMLPDSGADYLGSQGYVNFSTGINPALGLGDSITNDADIYFDFQPPVITNTAKTTIVNNIAIEEEKTTLKSLNAYPNPARDKLIIENLIQTEVSATLLSTTGQLISKFEIEPKAKLEFDCSNLPVGLYILQTSTMSFKLLITH